jgi:hypothetical protein
MDTTVNNWHLMRRSSERDMRLLANGIELTFTYFSDI